MPIPPSTTSDTHVTTGRDNIAHQLSVTAAKMPDEVAIIVPAPRRSGGSRSYSQMTFRELESDSNRLAAGFQALGITPGQRIVLMVRPGFDFISLTFALFKAGAVVVLVDPGMGRRNLIRCLQEARPAGFVAIPLAHAARLVHRRRFPHAQHNVTVGRRWFWTGPRLSDLRLVGDTYNPPPIAADDPAAIIFTTGSTGPPKGVLYQHGNFATQVEQLRETYGIQPGEVDLAAFPLFALFNSAMGVTTVIPDMDPTKPAEVDPLNIIEPVRDLRITQAFGSPALWNRVGQYCEQHDVRLPSLRRLLSAGAPVPVHVLECMKNAIASDGDIHTPYGATEALPVATISATEVLNETATQTAEGAGTCVGRRFSKIKWKVIRIHDDPIETIDRIEELAVGQIGELIVQGPVVTQQYVTREEANAWAKIADPLGVWHRMGDVGYLDEEGRFWFCGRKAHRVMTTERTMFTIPCEAVFNQHPSIYRSALVGIGSRSAQRPVVVAEPWPQHFPRNNAARRQLIDELYELGQASPLTDPIAKDCILIRRSLPVDIRHNAKIFREQIAEWVASTGACSPKQSAP